MLCEECGKNEATVSITLKTGKGSNTRMLCRECVKKMESSLSKGDIQGFLSSILSVLNTSEPKKETAPSPACSGCGLTYAEFEHSGRLGCAQCYRDFSEQLRPLLQRVHGRAQHAGRKPAAFTPDPKALLDAQIMELRQKMDEAVAVENFEDAAKYRDELRALTESKEAANG
ncbi:MAG: UvrB/UvrC motif-containing protein [Clostridia bacterium]|nr:UvrB/UvrC motif-containing protein [Clostridia bacterium]